MAGFRVERLLECSQATYWGRVFFDDEYNRRFFYDELHFVEWSELERKDEGERVRRRVKATPRLGDLPAALKAVIGEGIGYEENGFVDKAKNRYEARAVPSRLGDKILVAITMTTEPAGDERCRLLVDGTVTARVLMVGGLIEQRMVADLRRSYEKSADFTNRFIAEKAWR